MTGRRLDAIIPERFRAQHARGIGRMLAAGGPRQTTKTVELVGRRRDGAEFPLELSFATWSASDGRYFTAIMRDVSERKETEEAMRRYADEQAALYAVASVVATTLDREELLHKVLEVVLPVVGADAGWIDPAGPRLRCPALRGGLERHRPRSVVGRSGYRHARLPGL